MLYMKQLPNGNLWAISHLKGGAGPGAVRGEIVKMAADIKKQMEQGQEFPFKKVVMCNIGNPQALGQKPITFFRQVLALCEYPQVGPQARMHWGYSKSRPDHSGALWKPLRGG